jgi:hypothetical protein
VAIDTARRGTAHLLETLRAVKGLEVIEPRTVEAKLGVDLTEQANKCEYDVFCLVEVGEILAGDQLLIGHIRQRGEGEERRFELKLIVLDVPRASITEVLIWNVAPAESALRDATRAAARRLFAPPDVNVEWRIDPPDARITLFGDPYRPEGEGAVPFWSGAYHARLEAEGYHPLERRIIVPKQRGMVAIELELEPDPLYVASSGSGRSAQPFDKSSRRIGSGVSAAVAGAAEEDDSGSAFLNPFAWGIVGVGAALSVVGIVVMSGAQSSYNDLSVQERFTPGVTVTAEVAMRERDDHAGTFRVGSLGVLGGLVVMVGGVAWMVIDQILMDEASERSSRMSAIDPVPSAPAERAARAWARALYGEPGS